MNSSTVSWECPLNQTITKLFSTSTAKLDNNESVFQSPAQLIHGIFLIFLMLWTLSQQKLDFKVAKAREDCAYFVLKWALEQRFATLDGD